ncbi:putative 2-phosphosulfolactate phosphatase [Polynucleobacter sp. SHI8]|uniref:2-phosphosulfolactate phosphatase n=1 Tax=unclassified Polynucleobacter TaxID=2640945 RepID=UPI0024920400|nr:MULTISPECIES: 2-phosphosulfolactate phosphatase [unclassified Polynucleobacter]BDW11124.1 putative 2-phosphosulfolactate phosphatase [Polynucleobacter sp. SHI2]BDW13570.1 putative 2-phosphosulfolactate phosphatase [Polynucleobacter sp. SHI8]
MNKLHVLTNKSELKKEQLHDKIVIVLDILIATTSIVTAMANGCGQIIPVRNYEQALTLKNNPSYQSYKFSGELNADTLFGFIQPTPIALLRSGMENCHLVYCTTNGTVALNDCKTAKKTLVGCLLNAQSIVQHVMNDWQEETILIVCSGSNDQFNIEDFYGAGYFVETFLNHHRGIDLELSDSAKAAQLFHGSGSAIDLLNTSRVGKMLNDRSWSEELVFAAQKDIYPVVPYLTPEGKVELI